MSTQDHLKSLLKMYKDLDMMIIESDNAGMSVVSQEYRVIKELVKTRFERMNRIVDYVNEANQRDLI